MRLTEDNIADYADTLVLQVKGGGRILDYSPASIAVLEDLFRVSDELLRLPTFPENQRGLLVFYNGCYLGEVMARHLGGVWRFDEDDWANSSLVFAYDAGESGGLQVFPFRKILRRVTEGPVDNDLTAYYVGLSEKLGASPTA